MRRHDVADRGSKIAQMRRSGIRGRARPAMSPQSPWGGARSRRRRRHRRPCPRCCSRRRTPLNAFSPSAIVSVLRPVGGTNRERSERVANVVGAQQRHLECSDGRSRSPDPKSCRCRGHLQVVGLPVEPSDNPNVSTLQRAFAFSARASGIVGAKQQQTAPRHQITRRRKAS